MNFKTCITLTGAVGLWLSVSLPTARAADVADTNNEAVYIGVLQSPTATPKEKDDACVWLKHGGTVKSVAALAALLNDDQLAQTACHALESMRMPEVEDALIAALGQTTGLHKAGVVKALGVHRDAKAVPELSKLLGDSDAVIARTTAASLGDIATADARKALEAHLDETDAARQGAVIDGCLHCAQYSLAAGNHKEALAIYQDIFQRQTREFYHVAAFRGLVLASGSHGVELMTDAIAKGPAGLQMEAIQLIHEKQIPGVTKAVAGLLPNLEPLAQAYVIDGLGQRDDPEAVPAIVAIAKQGKADARVAAVNSLGLLGSDKEIPLLVDIAATAGDPAQAAARQALGLVHRGNGNQALLDLLPTAKPEAQTEIVRALTARTAVESTPQLLKLAHGTDDSLRDAALQALARLVDQKHLEALVQIVGQMKTDAGRSAAASALGAACRHIQRESGTVDMAPVWAALKNGSAETRAALYPACSTLSAPEAREALRAGIADSNPAIHAAAVRALCDTVDPELIPDVARLATNPAEAEYRTIAIEACVRLTTQEESIHVPDAERLKLFETITPVASSPAEKRVILSGLALIPCERSLKLAEPLAADATVKNEAARAVVAICRLLPNADVANATLDKVIAQATDDSLRQDAQNALKQVQSRASYITTWQYAGPYAQAGKGFRALFDIAFPPETAGAQGVNWKDLPLSDDPATPWAMDLLKPMGGEQEAAYARTSIHSDGDQEALLTINSDDGVKVWLNGKVIHGHMGSRSLTAAPDKVKVTLKPGWNELMLKVTQNNAGWGFIVRLTDAEGGQLKGVQYAADSTHNPM